MKINRPKRWHDELADFLFIRKPQQTPIDPGCSLSRRRRAMGRRLGTHRVEGRSEKQEGWQADTINNPANRAWDHIRLRPSMILPVETVVQHDLILKRG